MGVLISILNNSHDIIAAIATAPGRGGIGVIRVSGPDLGFFINCFFGHPLKPRHAYYLPFKDKQGQAIDAGIVLYFPAPHSYTGEDVLELQGHGGPAVLRQVLERCFEAYADGKNKEEGKKVGVLKSLPLFRHAQPGEFTQRAFLNERLDLAQAEAVADLINASSDAAARSAMASLRGAFSKEINQFSDRIIHLRMLVEATLDFPEEEINFLEKYQAAQTLTDLRSDLSHMIRQAKQGMVLRDGLRVVLAGQPNVGKSSLLNALAGDDIAIVTDIAGTTRDRIIQQIHINGVPLHIIDTAGLRDASDEVERIGIERTWSEIERADLIIHLQDARDPGHTLDTAITQRLPLHTPVLTVYNKQDLLKNVEKNVGKDSHKKEKEQPLTSTQTAQDEQILFISAKIGSGLDDLRQALLKIAGWQPGTESPWLARQRHVDALNQADSHLALAAEHASHNDQVLDLFAEELRLAHDSLCSITGQFTSDDLLGEIFSSFCIGK